MRSYRGSSSIHDLVVFGNGRKAFSGHKMLAANVWDLTVTRRIEFQGEFVKSLRVCNLSGFATAVIGHRVAALWNLRTGDSCDLVFKDPLHCVGIDPQHGELVALVGNEIQILDLADPSLPGRTLDEISGEFLFDGTWSHNGQVMAVDNMSSVVV